VFIGIIFYFILLRFCARPKLSRFYTTCCGVVGSFSVSKGKKKKKEKQAPKVLYYCDTIRCHI
jgi:hypothetical protein